jgi:hypothetical protein
MQEILVKFLFLIYISEYKKKLEVRKNVCLLLLNNLFDTQKIIQKILNASFVTQNISKIFTIIK